MIATCQTLCQALLTVYYTLRSMKSTITEWGPGMVVGRDGGPQHGGRRRALCVPFRTVVCTMSGFRGRELIRRRQPIRWPYAASTCNNDARATTCLFRTGALLRGKQDMPKHSFKGKCETRHFALGGLPQMVTPEITGQIQLEAHGQEHTQLRALKSA